MTAVAPVSVQEADRAVLQTNARGVFEIGTSVVLAANEGHPGGGATTHVKWNFQPWQRVALLSRMGDLLRSPS